MGMYLGLAALSDESIERLLGDPPLIWRLLHPAEPELYLVARGAPPKPTLLARLFGRRPAAPAIPAFETPAIEAYLDKAWHGIHYLLTGSPWEGNPPWNFLVAGGRTVGDIDIGYGPARVLSAAETRETRDALRTVTDDDLRARFDADSMNANDIYPSGWNRSTEEDDTSGYVMGYVTVLRQFLDDAVDRQLGIVIHLS